MNARRKVAQGKMSYSIGKDVYSSIGEHLGCAASEELAKKWAANQRLRELCERAAKGEVPTVAEFAAAMGLRVKAS